MTDQLDEQHARVALNLLAANATITTFDSVVPNPTPDPPYLLVYTQVYWPAGEAGIGNGLDHASRTCVVTWIVHHVGLTAAACRTLTMQSRSALLDVRGSIPGRDCTRITQDDVQPPGKDETTGRAVMDAVVTYSMTSVPG